MYAPHFGKLAMPAHVSGTLLEYCGSKEQRCLHYACDALSLSATPPRPSAGPLYLPHPPAPPSLPLPPPLELVPPWFKVCCWSLIKGRPIPPFSFQPYVPPYVLFLGQLLLTRAGTLKHQPKEVRQPAAAQAFTAMQPGSRRQSVSSFSNPIQHSEQ